MSLENIISKAKNGLKKALFTAGLLGALAGGAREAKATSPEYFENFTNPDSVNSWVVRDNLKFHHDTFEGDGVLKIEWDQREGHAYYETTRNENNPFILKWDSYLMYSGEPGPSDDFLFGIYADDKGIQYYNSGEGNVTVLSVGGPPLDWHDGPHADSNAKNKWMHHILSYGPETDAEGNQLARLQGFVGKGTEAPENLAYDLQMYTPFYPDANKVGLRFVDEGVYGYIDNVYFKDIPEPATLGLVVAGGLAGLMAGRGKRRKT